eukprot:m.68609 g.68609  ORF g.68609 m.68609 type:complete len:511 (+) comp11983_c0_seq1:112-1644(+)
MAANLVTLVFVVTQALFVAATDPCSNGTVANCGKAASGPFCSYACTWDASTSQCITANNGRGNYPLPANTSLQALASNTSLGLGNNTNIFFYGDSITYLNAYEPLINEAIQANLQSRGDNRVVKVVNEGVNGGTVKDLVVGYSPWGHLDPSFPITNISFLQTIQGLSPYGVKPDIAAIQIGINDVWQTSRGSNVTEFISVLESQIVQPCLDNGVRPYLVSVTTIGEKADGENEHDAELDSFDKAQMQLATKMNIPFVNARDMYQSYDKLYNCMDLANGILTGDGVHPTDPGGRGAMMLANAHASGILAVLQDKSLPNNPPAAAPKPPPPPPTPPGYRYGGRLFFLNKSYPLNMGGIKGSDAICTAEAGVPSKSLLVDETGCEGNPCRRATITPNRGDGQIDWPLLANRVYRRFDNSTALGWTTDNALLNFPLFWYISDTWMDGGCRNQASGMNSTWNTAIGKTCQSWSSNSSTDHQAIGWTCSTDGGMFSGGGPFACDGGNAWLCVTLDA